MTLDGPTFTRDMPWFRGNLHSHTTESDGTASPAEVAAHYRSLAYDFLAISDHDILTRLDPASVPAGLTLLPALEAGVGPHILCVGIRETFPKTSDRKAVIDRVTAQGGIAILNHPNWGRSFSHWDQDVLESLRGYAGIEIYNAVIEVLEGSPLATDRWDRLLTAGARVWGFATDDSHNPLGVGHGWIMVQAESSSPGALLDAMRRGRFFASTGVGFTQLEAAEGAWTVSAPGADRIRFVSQWGRTVGMADALEGRFVYRTPDGYAVEPVSATLEEFTVRYPFRSDEGYVRCEALGRGGRMAWTQPVWITP